MDWSDTKIPDFYLGVPSFSNEQETSQADQSSLCSYSVIPGQCHNIILKQAMTISTSFLFDTSGMLYPLIASGTKPLPFRESLSNFRQIAY